MAQYSPMKHDSTVLLDTTRRKLFQDQHKNDVDFFQEDHLQRQTTLALLLRARGVPEWLGMTCLTLAPVSMWGNRGAAAIAIEGGVNQPAIAVGRNMGESRFMLACELGTNHSQ